MFVIVAKYLIPKGFAGLTVFPFIFLKEKRDVSNPVMMQHEKIHIRQQMELLILLFFIWYGIEYFIRILQYKNKHLAYRNISFEREAYANESKEDFLEERRFWNFLNYIRLK
jgi:hypothetical protein